MRRFCVLALVAGLLVLPGCKWFQPEPQPVPCYPAYYYQACPQVCVPATTAQQCTPASASPAYSPGSVYAPSGTRPAQAAPGPLTPVPATPSSSSPLWPR